jgi:predicted Zn-dependent protease with MMP-like domain
VQIENVSPHLSPPRINNLNNDTESLIPDDFFSLMDELIDELEQQDNEEVILPEITIYKKRR